MIGPQAARRAAALLVTATLLAGCATLPHPAPTAATGWEAHRARVAGITSWRLVGRLGVRAGGQAFSAGLRWTASPAGYVLRLSGPLGRGALEIDGGPRGVRVRDGEGHEYRAADADRLAARLLGWPLPVSALSWWVRGLPAPGLPVDAIELDERGRLQRVVQGGWQVEVLAYVRHDGVALPQRLRVTQPDRRLDVRVAIREWAAG